jgi:hypothetical protein
MPARRPERGQASLAAPTGDRLRAHAEQARHVAGSEHRGRRGHKGSSAAIGAGRASRRTESVDTDPGIQLVTVADLLSGRRPKMPTAILPYLKAKPRGPDQLTLG